MTFGVDYSSGVPSVAALKAAGVVFVARYISPGARRKDLTRAEADALRSGGIGVVTVYEDTVGDARAGRAGGRTNAAFVREELARLGAPDSVPCYFAVDYDARGELDAALAYIVGAADVLGRERTGVYGGYYAVKACLDAGTCKYGWQTLAWSDRQWDSRAHIRQQLEQVVIGGVSCDRDVATTDDYGQWDRREELSMADAQAVLDAIKQLRQDLVVDGTLGLADSVEKGAARERQALQKLDALAAAVAAGFTDAQLDHIAAQVAARLEIAGGPTLVITGEATPKAPA